MENSITVTRLSCRRTFRRFHMALSDSQATDGEERKIPPVVAVFRQALATFPPSKDFDMQFDKLKSMMDRLRAEDFSLDPVFSDLSLWRKKGKPPCTYIEVFQNQDVNMGIFILAPGYKMPLHDHPHMHGLLKVLHGVVRIRSFTEYSLTEESESEEDIKEACKIAQSGRKDCVEREKMFYGRITSDVMCKEDSPTCTLTPTHCNLHEIQALELPAAFFDILSPPYDEDDATSSRQCHYYRVKNEISANLVQVVRTEQPDDYYCDQAPYLGPLLS